MNPRPPLARRLLLLVLPMLLGLSVLTACGGASRPKADTTARSTASHAATPGPAAVANSPVPLLAFFYQWFDASSWGRAKVDYPSLGRYSSDDVAVIKQQIAWAKSAGIQGFIVSWKDTPADDRRLRLLMGVARQQDFKLAMIYQGLDFKRKALPVAEVAKDFARFRDQYASDPVFLRLGGKPLTIWSGTWSFNHTEVAQVTAPVRGSMLVLNTEKSVKGYRRIADVTDGDAYYWSSVDPGTNPTYAAKLSAMSTAIHQDGKYWIAPFAPGFDARLVGGTQTVARNGGQTLRTEYSAAVNSSPDVLGLISWNEFSENTYVEPSQKYGTLFLDTLRQLRTTPAPSSLAARDSNQTPAHSTVSQQTLWTNVVRLGGFAALLAVLSAVPFARRRRRRRRRAGRAEGLTRPTPPTPEPSRR
jgi:hypothetical protein